MKQDWWPSSRNTAHLISDQPREGRSPINSAVNTQLRACMSALRYYILPIKHHGQPPHLYRFAHVISNLVIMCWVSAAGSITGERVKVGGGDGAPSVCSLCVLDVFWMSNSSGLQGRQKAGRMWKLILQDKMYKFYPKPLCLFETTVS